MRKHLSMAVAVGCLFALGVGCGGAGAGGEGSPNNPQALAGPSSSSRGGGTGPQSPPGPSSSQPAQTPAFSREWYVSPQGSDTASGTREAPFRTIARGIASAGPGEAVRVLAGTYAETLLIGSGAQAGTPSAKITLLGEGTPKIIPGAGGGWAMLQVQRPHWVIQGFEIDVKGQRKVALSFSGNVEGSALKNSDVHGGTLTAGVSIHDGARGVTIEGNRIHHFSRGDTDSHGVVVQPTSGDITVRDNEIHHTSGDSVQCIGPEGYSNDRPADGLLIENNHFHDNRENGVDIKTCWNVTVRNNRMHGFRRSSSSKGEGIVIHMSAKNVTVENNEIYDAGKGIAVGGNRSGPRPTNIALLRNRIHDILIAPGADGSGIRIENCDGLRVEENTVVGCQGFALVVGYGTGGNSSGVTATNNILSAGGLVSLGRSRDGLTLNGNLYGPGAHFQMDQYAAPVGSWTGMSFDAWKAAGFDSSSSQCANPPALDSAGC